jgi:hypothetical protein
MKKIFDRPIWNLWALLTLFSSICSSLVAQDALKRPAAEPLHKRAIAEAWAAFRTADYEVAISNADICVTRFGEAAKRSQAALEEQELYLPIGKVSEPEKRQIGQYQILHDVATGFLIKGWAEENLGRTNEARIAFAEAKRLTLARCSIPEGDTFWSPADKASEGLARLKEPNLK